jgi:hypothetical protein
MVILFLDLAINLNWVRGKEESRAEGRAGDCCKIVIIVMHC